MGTELKNQEMVGGGLPVTMQSKTACEFSLTVNGES